LKADTLVQPHELMLDGKSCLPIDPLHKTQEEAHAGPRHHSAAELTR
jgi:hypothetical protein